MAVELGFKSLRGLKQSISINFGKNTYNKSDEIDITKLIYIASRKGNINATQSLFKRLETSTNTISTSHIYNRAMSLIDEIETRQGSFFYNSNGDDSKVSTILFEMYENKEITYKELKQTVIDYKLDLPIILAETEQAEQEFININNDLYCNYSHYNGVDTDYSVVNPNLSYDTVVECNGAYEQGLSEEAINAIIDEQKETQKLLLEKQDLEYELDELEQKLKRLNGNYLNLNVTLIHKLRGGRYI